MARGGYRPGAGRKKGGAKATPAPAPAAAPKAKREPAKAAPAATIQPPQFLSGADFALWVINTPSEDVSMDQKLRAMQGLLQLEAKGALPGGATKKEAEAEALGRSMGGRFAARQVKGFSVHDGGRE